MRRTARPQPIQLSLRLVPAPEPPLPHVPADEPTLVQALADLLLAALGQRTPGDPTAATATEDGDEPEDHL
jgi:hypothetical protein